MPSPRRNLRATNRDINPCYARTGTDREEKQKTKRKDSATADLTQQK
jgi:hypothetical protein